jgi:hypothetical protein
VVVVVACGGADGGGRTVGNDGGNSDGRDVGGGDAGEDAACTLAELPGNRTCVPMAARAGEPLFLTVEASNACLPCSGTLDACRVVVGSHVITLSMAAKTCPPSDDRGCSDACEVPHTECKLPALDVGTYVVHVAGDTPSTGLPPRELVVTKAATETSCSFAAGMPSGGAFDGSAYGKCSDDLDCVVATGATPCQPCECPDLAVSAQSLVYWKAAYRAQVSLCPRDRGHAPCAACPPVSARCVTEPGALTGTCALQ